MICHHPNSYRSVILQYNGDERRQHLSEVGPSERRLGHDSPPRELMLIAQIGFVPGREVVIKVQDWTLPRLIFLLKHMPLLHMVRPFSLLHYDEMYPECGTMLVKLSSHQNDDLSKPLSFTHYPVLGILIQQHKIDQKKLIF